MSRTRHHAKKPLPGSWRMRNNASKRSANWTSGDNWLVIGGSNPHVVTAGQYNKPETFTCDCGQPDKRPDHLCCHIIAVMREM